MKTHKDLNVWKKSIDLVTEIYKTTREFPREELYGLTAQLRRSAISVPSNIAEGAARKNNREFVHFLYISLGSLSELETQMIIAKNLNYISTSDLLDECSDIGKMLINLIKYYKNK